VFIAVYLNVAAGTVIVYAVIEIDKSDYGRSQKRQRSRRQQRQYLPAPVCFSLLHNLLSFMRVREFIF
jgi:hypothetical protein